MSATDTKGFEAGLSGYITPQWQMAGGYAYTDARIIGATSLTIVPGNRVGLVPYNTFSLWNNYQFLPKMGVAVGLIYRSEMFATIDNSVTLPGYTRADAALYYSLTSSLRLQLNAENLFDKEYWANADSNTNLSPGSPRAFRLGLTAKF